ncbi:MAG TPA: DNA oxidative demethylase AlkB [Acetobacteraceae bacterium]|jgi:DNA oxidative demethylase|nr:DNA oxidative demethylase AlkB [Acetobacteraceae bacterium]
MSGDLLAGLAAPRRDATRIGEDAMLLPGFAAPAAAALLAALAPVLVAAPFRHMVTPGGHRMSVAMTSAGTLGWVTDRSGYRYDPRDPETGRTWPPMAGPFTALATNAATEAGFPGFAPDSCLINRYTPRTQLSLHQDRNERDFSEPIVSVSLGLPATFLWGGTTRTTRPTRIPLEHGDVVVWGRTSRLTFHGIALLKDGTHPLTGACRINLTFRRAG